MSRLRLNCAEGLEPSLFGSHCNTPEEVHIVMGALGLFVYPTALLLELYVHVSAKKRFLTRDFEFKAVRILRATNIVAFLLTTHPLAYDRDWDDQTPEAQLGFVVGCTSFVYGASIDKGCRLWLDCMYPLFEQHAAASVGARREALLIAEFGNVHSYVSGQVDILVSFLLLLMIPLQRFTGLIIICLGLVMGLFMILENAGSLLRRQRQQKQALTSKRIHVQPLANGRIHVQPLATSEAAGQSAAPEDTNLPTDVRNAGVLGVSFALLMKLNNEKAIAPGLSMAELCAQVIKPVTAFQHTGKSGDVQDVHCSYAGLVGAATDDEGE
eukprot:g222.t1